MATMTLFDVRKEYKHLYYPSARTVGVLEVPPMSFLMVDGQGDPGGQAYLDAVGALYAVSFTLKFLLKKGEAAIDYSVLPLEGLWWTDDRDGFDVARRERWQWTGMIMQPPFITPAMVEEAIRQVAARKDTPALSKVRFATFHEGLAAQILHLGPYSAEGPTIERLHRFIAESGHALAGKHHEIYLSDPRRAAPERLKTVIRQPMVALSTPSTGTTAP
jgi:hypothetical protein